MQAMKTSRSLRTFLAVLMLFGCASAHSGQHDGKVASRPLDPASAPNLPALDAEKALKLSQSVLNQPLGDFALLDRNGKPVRLADYHGKPLLVSFIYTGCFEVCPTTTKNLQKAVTNTVAVLGTSRFNVVSIGFNQPFD